VRLANIDLIRLRDGIVHVRGKELFVVYWVKEFRLDSS
jgi:hypothetical protein